MASILHGVRQNQSVIPDANDNPVTMTGSPWIAGAGNEGGPINRANASYNVFDNAGGGVYAETTNEQDIDLTGKGIRNVVVVANDLGLRLVWDSPDAASAEADLTTDPAGTAVGEVEYDYVPAPTDLGLVWEFSFPQDLTKLSYSFDSGTTNTVYFLMH